MEDAVVYLSQLPFWKDMTQTQKADALGAVYRKHYEPGEILLDTENTAIGLIVVLTGEIRAYLLSEEGREVTLYRLLESDIGMYSMVGTLANLSLETHMEARKPTDLLIISRAVFERLMEENMAVRAFSHELTAKRFAVIIWVFQQILFTGFDQRLATYLLEEYRLTGSAEINKTQEQIAEYINSAREVVARMLRRFAADGIIENRRGTIHLVDIPALRRICGNNVVPEELTKSS